MDNHEIVIEDLDNAPYKGAELIAYSIMRLALAADRLASEVQALGNGDAATHMGAIEAFGVHLCAKIEEFGMNLGDKLDGLTDALTPTD